MLTIIYFHEELQLLECFTMLVSLKLDLSNHMVEIGISMARMKNTKIADLLAHLKKLLCYTELA